MHAVVDIVAQYLIWVVLAGAAVAGLTVRGDARWRLILQTVIGVVVMGLLVQVANHSFYDTRPFVLHHVRPWFSHPADNGFPSDHTVVASLVAFLLWPYRRKTAVLLLAGAVAVGAARVIAQVHSPLDIAAAIVIALVAAIIGLAAGRAIHDRWRARRIRAADRGFTTARHRSRV